MPVYVVGGGGGGGEGGMDRKIEKVKESKFFSLLIMTN